MALKNVIILLFLNFCCGRDLSTVSLVKDFIENEQKPTDLVYSVCWKKYIQVKLVKQMMNAGVKSSGFIKPKHRNQALLFLLDLDCTNAEEIIRTAISNNLFKSPYRWLVLTKVKDLENLKIILDIPIYADSDFVIAKSTDEEFHLIELYFTSTSNKGLPRYTTRGYYNGTLTDVRPYREPFKRRRDIMGHTLIMSNVIQESNTTKHHLITEDRINPHFDVLTKLGWSNIKLAFEMLNATPKLIFSNRWGYQENGKWSGMINELMTNKADLGTNCLILKERLEVVSFVDGLATANARFVFRQPPLSSVTNIFSLPFSSDVWIALVVCSLVSVVALFSASKYEAKHKKTQSQLDGTVGDALFLTISAISQQGCVIEPKKSSGRLVVLVLFATMMAMYAAYSANIVVLLQAPSNYINNLAQLSHSKLTLAAVDADYNHFIFRLYKDPIRVNIYKRIEPEKGKQQFYELDEGIERIRQGHFALHSVVDQVYRRIEETFLEIEKCDLMEIDFLDIFDPCTPMTKDSPYLELFRVALKQIRESGLSKALSMRLQVPKPKCSNNVVAFSSVGLLNLQPVLILMIYGILLSIAVAIVEVAIWKFTHRSQSTITEEGVLNE